MKAVNEVFSNAEASRKGGENPGCVILPDNGLVLDGLPERTFGVHLVHGPQGLAELALIIGVGIVELSPGVQVTAPVLAKAVDASLVEANLVLAGGGRVLTVEAGDFANVLELHTLGTQPEPEVEVFSMLDGGFLVKQPGLEQEFTPHHQG